MISKQNCLVLSLLATAVLTLFALPNVSLQAQDATAETTASATVSVSESTAQIVAAANTFLNSLDDAERAAVMFNYNDRAQRENWSNFPTGAYNRAGLTYSSMTDAQRTNMMALLKLALSDKGYQQVIDTMTADEVLGQSEGNESMFGYGLYFVSFLGTPSETDPWILQWGGHHLGLNISFAGANEVLTPSHTGCQPCTYMVNDQEVRVLGEEYTRGLALLNALDAGQQATAILDYSITNLVDGPGEEDRVLEPEGIPGSQLTAEQKTMLLDVIHEWVGMAPSAAADARMAEIESHLDDTYFAWSGSTSADDPSAYFRVTGPTLLIEYAPQGTAGSGGPNGGGGNGGPGAGGPPSGGTRPAGGGSNGGGGSMQPIAEARALSYVNTFSLDLGDYSIVTDTSELYHVHTIYRDPTDPYGSALVAP